jgi:hypothetical protein
MKDRMVLDVKGGETLQLSLGSKLVGKSVTIPEGVSSVTVVIRDTAAVEQARARRLRQRAERPGRRRNRDIDR